ncbi:MAG: hypothetical protein Q4P33_03520 [Flaviflexus sp.]|nr:hypothetical protein [Flaviflexus sp.]
MPTPHRTARQVFIFATVITALTVMMGGLVCATESGLACPTWPTCHGSQIMPGAHLPGWIEFSHRLVSGLCLFSLILAAMIQFRREERDPWLRWLPVGAVAGAIAAAILGMSIVLWGISPAFAAFDLMCSLLALCAITFATVGFLRGHFRWRWTRASSFGMVALGSLLVMHALGVLVAGKESFTRCLGWPVFALIEHDKWAGLQAARWVAAIVVIVALGVMVLAAPRLRGLLAGLFGLIIVELALGAVLMGAGPLWLRGIYSIIAGAIVALTAYASVEAGLDKRRDANPEELDEIAL